MTRRGAIVLAVAAWLGVSMALLLIGPAMSLGAQRANCVYAFPLTGWARLVLNCDTAEFIRLAGDPAALLEPGNDRQSRPLFVLLAVALSWLWKPVGLALAQVVPQDPGVTWRDPAKVAAALHTLVPAYLGYLSINIAVLLGGVWLAVRMLPAMASGAAAWVVVGVLALLVGNDVVKAFVWSPHTQMLNIAMPLVATALILRPPSARGRVGVALGLGLAMLAYGNAAIGFAGLVVGMLRGGRKGWMPALAMAVLLFALPGLAWAGFVRWWSGDYYVVEMRRYGELVWITDTLRLGPGAFLGMAGWKLWFMLRNAAAQAVPVLAVGAYVAMRLWRAGVLREAGWRAAVAGPAGAAAMASLLGLLFFAAIGWEAGRLAYAAIPPLVWLVAMAVAAAAPVWRAGDAMVIVGAAFADTILTVAKAGPLS